jgi:hypothetical protein
MQIAIVQNSNETRPYARITHMFLYLNASNVKSHIHLFLPSPFFCCVVSDFFFLVYHAIKHANDTAATIATTLARATEAGPRASAPQQGRL